MDQAGGAWSNRAGRESIRSPVVRRHSTRNEAGAGRPIGATYADARSRRRATSAWVDTSILMSSTSDVRGNLSSRFHLKISKFASSASSPSVHGNISGIS